MSLHIDSLPNELLLSIFDLIPLTDLLQLGRVCSRWASLLPSACARRRTLVLIGGGRRLDETWYFHIPFNATFDVSFDGRKPYFNLPVAEREASVTLPSLNHNAIGDHTEEKDFTELARIRNFGFSGQLVSHLTDLFPNVDTLVVIHTEYVEDELNSVIGLLDGCWSLKVLKLWLHSWDIDQTYSDIARVYHHPIRHLLEAINHQSSLRQLTLDINGDEDYDGAEINFSHLFYSFIGQLEVVKLFLGIYDRRNAIWDIVHRFYNATQLRQIALGNGAFAPLDAALNSEFEFTTKVCQLYHSWNFETRHMNQFGELCLQYPSLTALDMYWSPHITFTQLITNLASLRQLTHLRLDIGFEDHPENEFSLVDRVEGGEDGEDGEDGEEEPRPISLGQVKILEVFISNKRSHHDFESLSPLLFPSVEVIILTDYSSSCTTCQPTNIHTGLYDPVKAKRCHRLLILSLKKKFSNNNSMLRLYAQSDEDDPFGDWTNYVRTEDDDDDDLAVVGDGDDGDDDDDDDGNDDQKKENKKVEDKKA